MPTTATRDNTAADSAENVTLAEVAYRRIRNDIINGELKPGQPLRLEALKARYGISFSPIREALNRLHSERLAVSGVLRGYSIAPLSREEIRETTDVRILIECDALRLSIENGGDAWEAAIVSSFHAFSWLAKGITQKARRVSDDDAEKLEARHREFHHALISECRSPLRLDIANQLYARSERYRRPALLGKNSVKSSRNIELEHKQIMDATLNRDVKKACALLAAHYRRTAESIEKVISDGAESPPKKR